MNIQEYSQAIKYEVPEEWYSGLYRDAADCCSAARPFSMIHERPADECWLFIHGYRGYPGELVRPAVDLYDAGFDVFVPRLPGHGTCGKDFIRSHRRDWEGVIKTAIADLKQRYATVHLLGHSMGTAIAAELGSPDREIGKIVCVCPSFENREMPLLARCALAFLSVFTPKVKCKWHASSKYHQHYENAPCDELYLGREYWQFYFTKQLLEYYRLMKDGLRALSAHPHEHLIVCPMRDKIISIPSVQLYLANGGAKENVAEIENGTHSILYDKDEKAEETAVKRIVAFAGSCTVKE